MRQYNALEYSLYLLKNRAQTERQLREKLSRKKFELKDIDETIAKLKKANFIDDEKFAHNYAQDKVRIYRRGRYRIALELRQKGISKDLIKKSTDEINEDDELEAALALVRSKRRQWLELDDQRKYLRTVGLLSRRGFSGRIIKEVVATQKIDDAQ